MKCMNFPGRVNERRIAALAKLKVQRFYPRQEIDIENLKSKILPADFARSIRTKKRRSGTQRLK